MRVHSTCPYCRRSLLIGAGDRCTTAFKYGRVCGFSLPIWSGNRDWREKVDKHSTAPVSGFVAGDHSWTTTTSAYIKSQEFTFNSGRLHFDVKTSCPILVRPLSDGGPTAKVHFPRSGTDESASWAVMPLGWRLQDLHHHYRTDLAGLVPFAAGDGLVVQTPTVSGGDYWVFSGGACPQNLSFGIDAVAGSGQQIYR